MLRFEMGEVFALLLQNLQSRSISECGSESPITSGTLFPSGNEGGSRTSSPFSTSAFELQNQFSTETYFPDLTDIKR